MSGAISLLPLTCLRDVDWDTFLLLLLFYMGYAVVQMVEAMRYKPEGRGFDSR